MTSFVQHKHDVALPLSISVPQHFCLVVMSGMVAQYDGSAASSCSASGGTVAAEQVLLLFGMSFVRIR